MAKLSSRTVLLATLGLILALAACHPTKKTYTIPRVKDAILTAVQEARMERRKGHLDKASDILLAEGRRVLKEYPPAVLRAKTVKKLLRMSRKIGNLCLDYGQELIQEAVSDKMWNLSNVFKKRYAKHQKLNQKLRELIARLPKTEVTARQTPAVIPTAAPTNNTTPSQTGADTTGTGSSQDKTPARPSAGSDEGPITP